MDGGLICYGTGHQFHFNAVIVVSTFFDQEQEAQLSRTGNDTARAGIDYSCEAS